MNLDFRKFAISFADGSAEPKELTDDTIMIGRLDTCAIRLDHKTVSRIHASISFSDSNFTLANLSTSNILTVNGRLLASKKSDVLADGDIIQIGPFTINVERVKDALLLVVNRAHVDKVSEAMQTKERPALDATAGGVLDVFWEKRSRDKEDWGTRLRPTEKPLPGKAMFNWKPTGDLRRPWRTGLFVWAFILIGGIAAFAYFRYPQVYAPEALASPHVSKIDRSPIAARSNGNSCTTCHNAREPLENACIQCHTAEQFHVSNTKAHQEAGITCTVCHQEHKGGDNSLMTSAIQSCAACHDNGNTKTFNGKSVRTAHGGSYGYPVVDGVWKWKGVYREVAEMIPEINSPATGDKDEQAKLSRHFHSVHVARLVAPPGVAADKFGLVSCSSCHKSFTPIDRTTPRQTCAACHSNAEGDTSRDARFGAGQTNCISCHVQHAYSGKRWSEFLSEESLKRRNDAVAAQIKRLEEK